eukprot:CAMPEP_0115846266 /NCGR_PEP_ID=MMETSP0287-20121206/9774_1 /TAXON_ID=412157 /ORGANISM="Chrysochromulina rotalis, Strain UIO044" /LENGTH=200 /DNA_ID=CAMNT_0003300055 /DNA_START=297 /DNA_END=896 /DNA_ORIENTATION=-
MGVAARPTSLRRACRVAPHAIPVGSRMAPSFSAGLLSCARVQEAASCDLRRLNPLEKSARRYAAAYVLRLLSAHRWTAARTLHSVHTTHAATAAAAAATAAAAASASAAAKPSTEAAFGCTRTAWSLLGCLGIDEGHEEEDDEVVDPNWKCQYFLDERGLVYNCARTKVDHPVRQCAEYRTLRGLCARRVDHSRPRAGPG